jgi:hypothetical protein
MSRLWASPELPLNNPLAKQDPHTGGLMRPMIKSLRVMRKMPNIKGVEIDESLSKVEEDGILAEVDEIRG